MEDKENTHKKTNIENESLNVYGGFPIRRKHKPSFLFTLSKTCAAKNPFQNITAVKGVRT